MNDTCDEQRELLPSSWEVFCMAFQCSCRIPRSSCPNGLRWYDLAELNSISQLLDITRMLCSSDSVQRLWRIRFAFVCDVAARLG